MPVYGIVIGHEHCYYARGCIDTRHITCIYRQDHDDLPEVSRDIDASACNAISSTTKAAAAAGAIPPRNNVHLIVLINKAPAIIFKISPCLLIKVWCLRGNI